LDAVGRLSKSGQVTVPQLAEHLGVFKPNLYRALEPLLERGLLTRTSIGARGGTLSLPQRGFPVLGRASAGHGTLADGEVQDYLQDLKIALGMDEETDFFVPVSGDSMQGVGICDGDLVGIRPSADPAEGEIVLALIEGEEFGVIKTFHRVGDLVVLVSENPAYPRREMFPEHVLIQGVYVGHISSPALKRRFGRR